MVEIQLDEKADLSANAVLNATITNNASSTSFSSTSSHPLPTTISSASPSPSLSFVAHRVTAMSNRPQLPRSFSLGGRNPRLPLMTVHSEPITPTEYALHIVFTQFVRYAEKKLTLCLSYDDPPIDSLLGVGADPAFDKILTSLGYIARHKPRPVIDAVMFWRKSKSEATKPQFKHKASKSLSDRSPITRSTQPDNSDRKSLISIYILCRVLIEVVKQTSADVLGDDMGDKLEEIVFKQIKTNPALLTSSVRTANWHLFAQLLGEMSNIRFASVSDMFVAELEHTTSKEHEINTQLVIHGMKYLKLKVYPMDAFEDSAEFIESISKFFSLSHGQRIKQAYCDVISELLLSISGTITAEVNHPTWAGAITNCYPRALALANKQRYWTSAFQLSCTLLCVAPSDFFSQHWLQLIEPNYNKLKDKTCRIVFITGVCRLLWVYLRRNTDSLNNALKTLDSITKSLFYQKKPWLNAEPGIVEACVQLIRVIAASHPEYALNSILFPLLSSDLLSVPDLTADNLSPERMLVGIRSFLVIMADASANRFPPFYYKQETLDLTFEVPPALKDHYTHFSELLGKIMLICDSHFGGQAILDEKLGKSPTTDTSQAKYELLLTVFEAVPLCIPSVSFGKIVEILCKGTAHPDTRVSLAAANALKSLAKSGKCQPQTIVTGFARFIFNFEERYDSTFDLQLYVELLNLWINVIKEKATPASKGEEMEATSVWSVIEEVEGNGLFFLCSQNRTVRRYAIEVLRLIRVFDSALNASAKMSRIIDVLEAPDGCGVLQANEYASTAEKVRLMRLLQESKDTGKYGILVRLAQSESGVDAALWLRMFPKFLTTCLSKFPMPVVLCRDTVCSRLLHLHKPLLEIVETKADKHGPHILIEQWKLYLIVACCTLTSTDDDETPNRRRIPKRITSTKALFRMVIPLLQVEHPLVRRAVIDGLGCININLYKTLLESLEFTSLSTSQPHFRRNKKNDGLRLAIVHVLQLTSHFLKEPSVYRDTWILDRLVAFIKDSKNFLSLPEVQLDWECQRQRRYFCGLMQTLYEGIQRTPTPTRWLPFEARVSLFKMIEEWSGYGENAYIAAERNEKMRKTMMEQTSDPGVLLASMEVEKAQLELAASSALASILEGSLTETIESHGAQAAVMSFDVAAIFAWTHSIFNSTSEKIHMIGRRAVVNMLKSNREHSAILSKTIAFCYSEMPRASESYFFAVADLFINDSSYPCDVRQPLALGLYKIGDEKSEVRVKAAAMLKAVELRFFGKSSLKDYEISISDRTTAVYKRAQFNLSNQFATEYDDLKYLILSELTMFFGVVSPSSRRDLLAILIPWISTVELQLDPNGKDPSPSAYMVMTNLFDITVRFSGKIQNEIEALWVTLASARHLGNVRAILDFLINSSVEKHDPAFVEYGKQIVVYLASTPAGAKLVEALVAYIQPTSMLVTRGEVREYPGIEQLFPYVADLSLSLPPSNAELAMILLVDLMVSPLAAMSENLALLLHVVFVLLDHFNPLVQEQARELLVHLIHELILSSDTELGTEKYNDTAEFIDLIRKRDTLTVWMYDDLYRDEKAMRKPKNMDSMIQKVFEIFMAKYPTLRDEWSRIALTWATTCPVRHFACRSFQIFRSSFVSIDQNKLADMLVRLSNTIADSDPGIQNFAMQILMTLNAIANDINISNYPQIFWATVACLQTIHQQEFIEAITILETLLVKFPLDTSVGLLMSVFPSKWEGHFSGLQKAMLPGLRSSKSYDQTMRVLDTLNEIDQNEIVGDETKLLYAVLANIPRFLNALENELTPEVITAAMQLTKMADQANLPALSRITTSLARGRFRARHDFIRQIVHALQASPIFYENEASVMVFLLGFLSNKIKYVRIETMEFLKYLFPLIEMHRPEFVAIGADMISPLLRLLQTDCAEQALQVLDEAMYIPGTEMDKHVLRASLGGPSTSATTFGVPNEDGWAVPNPAAQVSVTRNNVHAVFYSCEVSNPEYQLDPLQFSRDEFTGLSPIMRHIPSQLATGMVEGGLLGSSFLRSDTMASFNEDVDGQLNHMVAALDNLNSFFAEEPTAYTTVLE